MQQRTQGLRAWLANDHLKSVWKAGDRRASQRTGPWQAPYAPTPASKEEWAVVEGASEKADEQQPSNSHGQIFYMFFVKDSKGNVHCFLLRFMFLSAPTSTPPKR